MNQEQFTGKLKASLAKPLPGTDIQWEMASSDRMMKNFPRHKRNDSKLAAIIILLYPVNDKLHTIFIQRPVYEGVHSGQISFPGGKMERSDRNLEKTALRETCEEIGLCDEKLNILGVLTPLYIPVSNIEVSPFVAYHPERPSINHNSNEVVNIIEAPLKYFMNEDIVKEEYMTVRKEQINMKYYDYQGYVIWGATAMIIHELLVLLEREGIDLEK
ncbi:MAG TPA: CoA pyrophosphatase [Bacteroidales bacterium]|nr:CoA pyrophosphatase [Bacteroidales bacterium]